MDKIRLGVIGVGSVVREIYQYLFFRSEYSHLLEIAAIADPNDSAREWFRRSFDVPSERCFADYREMLATVELDAAQINTPDHLHADPTVACLEAGLDVMVPKPTAATVKDAHRMIEAARNSQRLLAIDFHKREDPRLKEAESRYQGGRYGRLQSSVWYMLDKLVVADPNADPPFFATTDYAEKNTPISFLTVHMCDALLKITDLLPASVRAVGYSHKLPRLAPIAVDGFDLCDTEIRLQNGSVSHIITGWHLPNTAHAMTVQSSRLICSEGMLDLGLDQPGYHELHADGIFEVNTLFKNFERDGVVTGYGMSSPGRIYQRFLDHRNGTLDEDSRSRMLTSVELGFHTTLVCQAAEDSLKRGEAVADGVTVGPTIDLRELCAAELGEDVARGYLG